MIVVTVTGTPTKRPAGQLGSLGSRIESVMAETPDVEIDRNKITVNFPLDRLPRDETSEIITQINCLLPKPGRTEEVLNNLAKRVAETIRKDFPKARVVDVYVQTLGNGRGFARLNGL